MQRLRGSGAMLDWNDLRYFLAVAQTGSTLAAGPRLKVSQTTAARRVAALEESLGLTLFERRQAGYALTPAGDALLAQAEAVEAAAVMSAEASTILKLMPIGSRPFGGAAKCGATLQLVAIFGAGQQRSRVMVLRNCRTPARCVGGKLRRDARLERPSLFPRRGP